jgi:hypothetical protein
MLEGVPVTVYGQDAAAANRLATLGGAVAVSIGETWLTAVSAQEYGYIVYLRCDCTAVGTTAGLWSLNLGVGGASAINLQMPVAAAPIGSSYCWPFPVPWKTLAKGGQFTLTPSVATMGTWVFICNGFYSSI